MKFNSSKLAITDLTYEEAKKMFDRGVKLYAGRSGAFGDDIGATVVSFDIKDAIVPRNYGEEEYGTPVELEEPVILSRTIGQSGLNWGEFEGLGIYAKIETRDVSESMSIREAKRILEAKGIKLEKV